MKATAGAHQVPNPSYVTQRDDGGTGAITTSETVLSTAPSIKGGDAPKKIDFSCNINPDGAGQVLTFRLYRNGTQISSASDTFRKGLPATTDIDPITLHWVDESPGKATPVYEVRATSTVDGTVNASSRRLTVHNI
jgi:hypothetical protein